MNDLEINELAPWVKKEKKYLQAKPTINWNRISKEDEKVHRSNGCCFYELRKS